MLGLTLKQKKFADEYIISGNLYQSAIKAGYSETYAKAQSHKLSENVGIKKYIAERLDKIDSEKIADQKEILQYWTSVMRGEHDSREVIILKNNDDTYPKTILRKPTEKESLDASKELAKRIVDSRLEESKEDKLDKLLGAIEGVYRDE